MAAPCYLYVFKSQISGLCSAEVKAASPVMYYWLLVQEEVQFSNFPNPSYESGQGNCCGEWIQSFNGLTQRKFCSCVCHGKILARGRVCWKCSSYGHWDHAHRSTRSLHAKLWRLLLDPFPLTAHLRRERRFLMGQDWRWLALLYQMLQWVATSLHPVKEAEKCSLTICLGRKSDRI